MKTIGFRSSLSFKTNRNSSNFRSRRTSAFQKKIRAFNRFKLPDNYPVIIGSIGGLNGAGRSGGINTAFLNMARDGLSESDQARTDLHTLRLMERIWLKADSGKWRKADGARGFTAEQILREKELRLALEQGLFIRGIPDSRLGKLQPLKPFRSRVEPLEIPKKSLPAELPPGWKIVGDGEKPGTVKIITEDSEGKKFVAGEKKFVVPFAAMVPDGVNLDHPNYRQPDLLPLGVKLSFFAVNDALRGLGVPAEKILQMVPSNKMGFYIGTAMAETGDNGFAGYVAEYLRGRAAKLKTVAFSLADQHSAWPPAYSPFQCLGHVSSDVAACATWILNISNAVRDIRSGHRLFVLAGGADSCINPWTVGAYARGALALEKDLVEAGFSADGQTDFSKASNPFSVNRWGFTMAESGQVVALFHPALARELGIAPIGAIGGAECYADGAKESITKPGPGDYLALGEVMESVRRFQGKPALREGSFVYAHGTSTEQNGYYESLLLDEMAEAYGIRNWPVSAVKSCIGHGMGAAGGDSAGAVLGAFRYHLLLKIRNLLEMGIGEDVSHTRLQLLQNHLEFDPGSIDWERGEFKIGERQAGIVVSKGFGGKNAVCNIWSPEVALKYLLADTGTHARNRYWALAGENRQRAGEFEQSWLRGEKPIISYNDAQSFLADPEAGSLEWIGPIPGDGRMGLKIRGLPAIPFTHLDE